MRIATFDRYEREKLSKAVLEQLLVFASGDPALPVQRLIVDWQAVFRGVCRNGLVGITYDYLKQQDDTGYFPEEFKGAVEQICKVSAVRMALVYRNLLPLMEKMNLAGLDTMVVKGPVVAYRFYKDPLVRVFNDLDLIIRERDWVAVHQFLLNEGFEQKEHFPEPPTKLIPQAVIYETKYISKELGLRVEVHYDDILNAGLSSRDVEGFWERAETVMVQGVAFKGLSLEDQLIHLCAHAHYHGYVRLNWFTDIALIIRDHADMINWERVIQVTRIEEAQVQVYYTLYFFSKLFDISVPEEVLEAVRPSRFQRWWHEYYMPEEQVLSMCPMNYPMFSFYFISLFGRLIPDFLVMGRRKEKLQYLLRLITPPGDWLRFYYHLDESTWLLPHYLLHPLKLVYVYIREIFSRLFKRGKTNQEIETGAAPELNSL